MSDAAGKRVASIKGTHDILPDQAGKWQWVESRAKALFELYGYREIRTPVFEATELFEKGTGPTSDIVTKEMYTFVDKGGRSLTLRPEYTPSVVRAIIEHRLNLQSRPMRFYFIGPMFRYDKPQKGRYRQFHQVDIEVFGEKHPAIDAEIVEMAAALLAGAGVEAFRILVNSVGCRNCRPAHHRALREAAEADRAAFCPDCQRKIDTNPLRIFDCKVEACRELAEGLPRITDYLCPECRGHFQAFREYLDGYGLAYEVDPRLVRGLDYYTKTTFEFVSSEIGAQDAILGGGRYDDMMKDFGGPDICGIGFALGLERFLSLIPEGGPSREFVFFAWMGQEAGREAMRLSRELRRAGIECLVEYRERSLAKQMGRADKLGARWALIIGEDEIRRRRFQLKDLKTGKQRELAPEDILESLGESD
jgi:histidyl-tRNA synthetase